MARPNPKKEQEPKLSVDEKCAKFEAVFDTLLARKNHNAMFINSQLTKFKSQQHSFKIRQFVEGKSCYTLLFKNGGRFQSAFKSIAHSLKQKPTIAQWITHRTNYGVSTIERDFKTVVEKWDLLKNHLKTDSIWGETKPMSNEPKDDDVMVQILGEFNNARDRQKWAQEVIKTIEVRENEEHIALLTEEQRHLNERKARLQNKMKQQKFHRNRQVPSVAGRDLENSDATENEKQLEMLLKRISTRTDKLRGFRNKNKTKKKNLNDFSLELMRCDNVVVWKGLFREQLIDTGKNKSYLRSLYHHQPEFYADIIKQRADLALDFNPMMLDDDDEDEEKICEEPKICDPVQRIQARFDENPIEEFKHEPDENEMLGVAEWFKQRMNKKIKTDIKQNIVKDCHDEHEDELAKSITQSPNSKWFVAHKSLSDYWGKIHGQCWELKNNHWESKSDKNTSIIAEWAAKMEALEKIKEEIKAERGSFEEAKIEWAKDREAERKEYLKKMKSGEIDFPTIDLSEISEVIADEDGDDDMLSADLEEPMMN